ncbi:hypothetical protein ACA910_015007 [Epithemia clementina (nom. ined.)]
MLGEIQALNHLGIDLIDGGDYEQAAEVFAHAISLLSGCSLQPTPLVGCPGSSNRGCEPSTPPEHRFIAVYAYEDEESASPTRSDFYCFPFHFECVEDAGQEDEPDLTSEQYNSCAITCLFNLGICSHLEWEERKNHSHLLQKALSYYEQAISLTSRNAPSPADPVLKVLMAVCANATHCNNELVDLEQVHRWNETLKQIIRFSADKDLFYSDHYFSMNAFFNGFGRVAAHAA